MKNVLIISEYIAPFQAIASIRWTKIAKYLKKDHDVDISILTINKRYRGINPDLTLTRIDGLLKKDLIYFDDYQMVPSGIQLATYYKIRNFIHIKKKKLIQDSYNGEKNESIPYKTLCKRKIRADFVKADVLLSKWILQYSIVDQIWKYIKKIEIEKYDVIISSYGPIWPHLVAEKIKRNYPYICWLADFRDQYVNEYDTEKEFKRHKNFVAEHCIQADYILRVNDRLNLYEAATQRVITINNGYDPDEAVGPLPPSKFNIVYTGTIYEQDDVSELFHIFKELIASKMVDEKDVAFQYAGEQAHIFLRSAHRWGMDGLVQDFGIIERKKALSLQQNAAILLMAGWNTKLTHCEWTGKMYEYMMMQKPIIYMMAGDEPYSLPSKDMEKLGGVCYEQCRHEKTYIPLKNYIWEKYSEWKNTGNVSIKGDPDYRSKYAYPMIAEQVWTLIQRKNKDGQR